MYSEHTRIAIFHIAIIRVICTIAIIEQQFSNFKQETALHAVAYVLVLLPDKLNKKTNHIQIKDIKAK